jgi:hypothetical protein
MSKVFKVTPKRIKRANGTVLTPEMSITVTTLQHANYPFGNGAKEIKEPLIFEKHAVKQMILSFGRWMKCRKKNIFPNPDMICRSLRISLHPINIKKYVESI